MGWIKDNIDKTVADYLFNVKVVLPSCTAIQRDIAPDIEINFELLEQQLQETPEMIAFWSMVLAEQEAKVEVCERRIKTTRGQIADAILKEARQNGYDIRSNDLKEIINQDKSLIEQEDSLIKSTRVRNRIKVVVESLNRKFDALRSLSGFKRLERNNT